MRAWVILTALAASTFLYVTTETLPIGLLPQIAAGLHAPPSAVGLLVTAYGLMVVVATIPLTRLTRRWPRSRLLAAFAPRTIGALARESLDERQRGRFEAALRQKMEWFGARLLPVRFATGSARVVADELLALRRGGAEVLIVAGASALDPLDPVFGGLALLGATMERHGAPGHPGSLLWVASWEGFSVVGMPACGMFSQATTFDLVLPRILTGEATGAAEIATLGHGGLLSRDSAYRFPPYRKSAVRGELSE